MDFKMDDLIILSEEGRKFVKGSYERMGKKIPKEVLKVVDIRPIRVKKWLDEKNYGRDGSRIDNHFFRLATEKEIKIHKIKKTFKLNSIKK
jgi:hypothetical protein